MSVTVVLSDEIAALLPQNDEAAEKIAQELIVLELYRRGAVSSGKAAQWLGMSKVEFIRYSGELGIPFFRITPEELEGELAVLETRRQKGSLLKSGDLTICNSSPLIALTQINRLDLLRELFGTVLIPHTVALEVQPTLPVLPAWMETRTLTQPVATHIELAGLDKGETEVISLALELSADLVIIDEIAGRHFAIG